MKKMLVGLLVAGAVGCAGTPEERVVEPMPFHVALKVEEVVELGGDEGDEDVPTYRLDREDLGRAFQRELTESGATKVTLLEPSGGAERDGADWWTAQAKGVGADLLLECKVSYRQGYESERNEKFWLNLPVFLLIGTLNLFVNDRDYTSEARLEARVVDLSSVYQERAELVSTKAQLLRIEEQFDGMSMDFVDRDGHKGATMLYSFFVPSAFLATETSKVSENLQEGVTDALATRLARFLEDRRSSIVRADPMYSFWAELDWTARRRGEEVQLSGDVFVQADGEIAGMSDWSISAGGEALASGEFGDGEYDASRSVGEAAVLRYPLDVRVRVGNQVDSVRLTLTEDSTVMRSRVFTLPVGGPPVTARAD